MATIDEQFVEYIVKTLVNNPDKVKIDRSIDEKGVLLSLEVDPEDIGRVIGRRGATAQSIRTLLRVLGTKNDARYNLKIVNSDGYTGGKHHHAEADEDAEVNGADEHEASAPAPAEAEMTNNEEDGAEDADAEAVEDEEVEEGSEAEPSDETDGKRNDLIEKTRAELADLDDLDL